MDKAKSPNLRQLVCFAIMMQNMAGIINKHPSYVFEKFKLCLSSEIPEQFLDGPNRELMEQYAKIWKLDWEPKRDYWNIPIGKFNERGEPTFPEGEC